MILQISKTEGSGLDSCGSQW